MTIQKQTDGKTLIIAPEGRLDTLTAPELEKELKTVIDDTDELIIDFEKLEYISSAGLRVMLYANQAMTGKKGMKIIHTPDIVREIFQITGLTEVLNVE